jgi:hypothetical protein
MGEICASGSVGGEGGNALAYPACLVTANVNLATARPLSGFLLKPVELFNRRASCSAHNPRSTRRTPANNQSCAGETRHALFDAFPVGGDGENAPPGGVYPP